MVRKFLEYISYNKIKQSGPSSGSLHEKKVFTPQRTVIVSINMEMELSNWSTMSIENHWTISRPILAYETLSSSELYCTI